MEKYWHYNPYTLPLFIAAILSLALTLFAWRRRQAPGAVYFLLLMLATAEWSLGYALELGSTDLSTKIFLGKIQYLGIVTTPVAWSLFILQLTHHEKWLTRRNLVLLAIVPLITLGLIWTTEAHGLMWRQVTLDTGGPFLALQVDYGPWFWFQWTFATALILLGTILLINMLVRSAELYRWQTGLLLFVALVPWVGNGLYIFRLMPVPNLDLTPLSFTLTGIALSWNLFHFRLLDMVPVARQVVVDRMSDGVIVLDGQNRVVDLNPAARHILAENNASVIGQTGSTLLSAWPHLIEQLQSASEKQVEISWSRAGQPERFFDVRISSLSYQQKHLNGRLVVLRDITGRKQAEMALAQAHDQAQEANRFKSQLLAKVSHELRTPLSAILGYAELLESDVFGALSPQQNRATREIIDSTHYLTEIVNELLDQAALESGQIQLHINSFYLHDLIQQVEAKMRDLAQTKNLDFRVEFGPEMPVMLRGDVDRVQQILVKLVSNAIKFTQAGQVKARFYRPHPDYWAIQVIDSGPGIPQEAQAYIFDPFRQVDGSVTREYAGPGLGLSIVKQLTTLMGGQIFLESELKQGSTFTVWLPLISIQENL